MGHAEFLTFSSQSQARINQALEHCLQALKDVPPRLLEAMHYSVLMGGKRIRPMLVYASAEITGGATAHADTVATAVELIHAYSLIHDDLPAMDDDALRRGQPTCHIAFDEATAILAGDALQTLAFEQLIQLSSLPAEIRLELIQTLTAAAGPRGMVAGQAIDIEAANHQLNLSQLTHMHLCKTGAMIEASVRMGALIGHSTQSQQDALQTYARAVGLAFQVQDDILDVVGNTETLGKTQGADQALNKPTFVSLLGLEGAQEKLRTLHEQSLAALDLFDERADQLRSIAGYIINRDH
jgi:geranylgeranyl pyrophosphate synthase